MAPYPNALHKYGLNLWRYIPTISWICEFLLILVAIKLIKTQYGTNKVRLPLIIIISMHLMSYPGVFTNIPYTLSKMFQNHQLLLHLNVGITFIGTYLIPSLFFSRCFDKEDEKKK